MLPTAPTVAIVDFQAGNLRSVQKALEKVGAAPVITSETRVIEEADGVVFPGQGACDASMRQLRQRGLVAPIRSFIADGKPYLGVCLGLQLLFDESDEGEEPCLGVLPGRVRALPTGQKIPHMGWNQVELRKCHPILEGVADGSYFYFVHSFYADPDDSDVVAGTTSYGTPFCSAAAWGNAVAVQFHPEKSGAVGLKIYENFVRLIQSSGGA